MIFDCTYRTNRYNHALFNIVGVDCLQQTFFVAFCFLAREGEEDFTWVLNELKNIYTEVKIPRLETVITDGDPGLANAVKSVFPDTTHLLCRWHHKQNVRTNCDKFFASHELFKLFQSDWIHCINASSESEFKSRWAAMRKTYITKRDAIQYLQKNWCGVKLPKIARFGTNQTLHFFNTSTSRAEGAHSALKSYLGTSNGDLKFVFDAMQTIVKNQRSTQNAAMNTDRTTYSRIYYDNPIFSKCAGIISTFAIKEVQKQFKLIQPNEDIGSCTHAFTRTTGLPCKHFLYQHITNDPKWKLDKDDFHKHWFYIAHRDEHGAPAPTLFQMQNPDV